MGNLNSRRARRRRRGRERSQGFPKWEFYPETLKKLMDEGNVQFDGHTMKITLPMAVTMQDGDSLGIHPDIQWSTP